MYSKLEHAAINRQLDKEVFASRLIHQLDNTDSLSIVGKGTMEISNEQKYEGKPTLKITYPTAIPGVHTYNSHDITRIRVHLDGENWEEYNRISFWAYPVKNALTTANFCFEFKNEGEHPFPRPGFMEGTHSVNLEAGRWNHIIWEIPDTFRDNVTTVQFNFESVGRQAHMKPFSTIFLSNLTLDKVDADKFSGWDTDGKIAFCHSGYSLKDKKIACCSLKGEMFEIIDTKTTKTVFSANAKKEETDKGVFYMLDFSDLTREGEYIIKYGNIETKPFTISDNHWDSAIDKLRTFFKSERCGRNVEHAHIACHTNVYTQHPDGRKLSVCGGWHDAADVSQGLCNTAEAAHTFIDAALKLKSSNKQLADKLLREAHIGAEWLLSTRFEDGYRCVFNGFKAWTSGVIGEMGDDFTYPAEFKPFENFCAVAAEVKSYFAFKETEIDFAEYCLAAAIEDFEATYSKFKDCIDASIVAVQMYAEASFAASWLYKATKDESYLEKAVKCADFVLNCQQTELPDWDIAIRGFFYEDSERKTPLSYDHRGHEQVLIMALTELLEVSPEHKDAKAWTRCLELYREFILKINEFSLPYGVLPAGVYSLEYPCGLTGLSTGTLDHQKARFTDEHYLKQLTSGIKLAEGYYLRRMPTQKRFCGHFGVMLSRAKAVSTLAEFFNDQTLRDIARMQLGWIVGCNPFARSYIYGEGYDFQINSCQFSPYMIGAVPVGIKAYEDEDVPYMPANAKATFYEIWVHSASRLLWTISDLL